MAELVHARLEPDGFWLSLIGSADGPPRDMGPPRISAREVAAAVEEFFEIIRLESTHLDNDRVKHPRAWLCLMRKRTVYSGS